MKDSSDGNRIWSSLTPDFITFSKPTIFFDPGYTVIDATIFHEPGAPFRLIFKQQSTDPLTYQERVATGPTLEGPWTNISGFINEPWSEGPSAIKVGDKYIVFYDHYRPPNARFEAVATTGWKHWEDITSQIDLPPFCKHGSFLKITNAEADRLLKRHDPPKLTTQTRLNPRFGPPNFPSHLIPASPRLSSNPSTQTSNRDSPAHHLPSSAPDSLASSHASPRE
jgi:hypothetical protein